MTPDAVKYQITLESEQRLRARTWQPGSDDDDDGVAPVRSVSRPDVAFTPTSRLIVWMLRAPNMKWAPPLALSAASWTVFNTSISPGCAGFPLFAFAKRIHTH